MHLLSESDTYASVGQYQEQLSVVIFVVDFRFKKTRNKKKCLLFSQNKHTHKHTVNMCQGVLGVVAWRSLDRYSAISVNEKQTHSPDTFGTKYFFPIHTTPITSVAALPVLMEQEAVTLDVTDLLVISGVYLCWSSDWAAETCHALIFLACQGKQS